MSITVEREFPAGIFCLEGEWEDDLSDRLSVRPVLDLLRSLGVATYIHRDAVTIGDFEHYLGKWIDEYTEYKILYLAMHGGSGAVALGKDSLSLDELGYMLQGACKGRVVYFGSCSTLKLEPAELQEFARMTGARAVIGYRRSVPWLETAAFEVLLLDRLARGIRSDAIFNRLVNEHENLARTLGLVVATRSKVHKVPLRRSRPKE
ncbi:hypothetical protein M3F59_00820 [Brachybacterium muris]|uniref:DUF6642 family protein n=1 Tax=Brachybacterium muris TaxID=219301 RepID=UPI00223AA8F5|nr:DUF6642 family protein [Brachybacterium muris]MCT2260184.1 hypothetical protein [Brachybacterium muris]